jgi:ATP-dependent Lon protease
MLRLLSGVKNGIRIGRSVGKSQTALYEGVFNNRHRPTAYCLNHTKGYWWKGKDDNNNNNNDDDDGDDNNDEKKRKKISKKIVNRNGKNKQGNKNSKKEDKNNNSDSHFNASASYNNNNAVASIGEGEDAPKPPTVMAVPLSRQPLFPSITPGVPLYARDLPTLSELRKIAKSPMPYVGAFMYKDSDVSIEANPLTDISLVYPVGTLAQVIYVAPVTLGGVAGAAENAGDNTSSSGNDTLPEDEGTLFLRGHRRIRLLDVAKQDKNELVYVNIDHLKTEPIIGASDIEMVNAHAQAVLQALRDWIKRDQSLLEQISFMRARIDPLTEPGRFADFVLSLLTSNSNELQHAFEALHVKERLDRVLHLVFKELERAKLQEEIRGSVEKKMQGLQREYFLKEQLKLIQNELGITKDDKEAVANKFTKRIEGLEIPESAKTVIDEELEKFESLEKNSAEFNVTRNYLDWLTSIPWGKLTDENFDIGSAQKILDEDHYGMEDAKDRVLEFIAVGKLKGSVQGKIICLNGPPGVGKTSIGKSIARALNREYYRFSVGGLSDVAEIKGHRRTYIGAMPGKIVQGLKQTECFNPLILIDEVDKLGRGHSGDPASALLELLDPSQNTSFVDHYLDVPLDLSQALFVCTSNSLDTIPGPLLDRMEVITLSGYDLPEKVEICEQYLEPKARKEVGLEKGSKGIPTSLGMEREATEALIRWYCREAGVRNLEKKVEKMYRKLAYKIVKEKPSANDSSWNITEEKMADLLGKPPFTSDRLYEDGTPPGVVMGLAYTAMGGSALYIETVGIKNENKKKKPKGSDVSFKLTGQLGDVMSESSNIALTVARRKLQKWDSSSDFFENNKIHLHVPEGAIKKDGPSAGVTMTTALISLALNRPIRDDLAMTGEISLTGKVLPVGGIKEKTIAARRAGISCLILPKQNKKDYDELPDYAKEDMEVHFCEEYDEVFDVAFGEDRFFDL